MPEMHKFIYICGWMCFITRNEGRKEKTDGVLSVCVFLCNSEPQQAVLHGQMETHTVSCPSMQRHSRTAKDRERD